MKTPKEKTPAQIFAEQIGLCETCGKEMDAMEHNYGTEDILTCIHCYNDAANGY